MTDHRIGELAYVDSFAGLVPCRVLAVNAEHPVNQFDRLPRVQVKLTATRGAYRKGEVCWFAPSHVVPRSCVRRSRWSLRIRTDYVWVQS